MNEFSSSLDYFEVNVWRCGLVLEYDQVSPLPNGKKEDGILVVGMVHFSILNHPRSNLSYEEVSVIPCYAQIEPNFFYHLTIPKCMSNGFHLHFVQRTQQVRTHPPFREVGLNPNTIMHAFLGKKFNLR